MAVCFGGAQTVMAGIGLSGGVTLGSVWREWDHWIALILLAGVGVKMIREALDEADARRPVAAHWSALLVLTIATSIDALAVGVSLPTLEGSGLVALTMIGVVTFVLTLLGVSFGRFLGERFGRTVEIVGGIGLIAIGISIVVDHTR